MDLSDELLRRAKKTAADRGVPLRDLVEDALRAYLSTKARGSAYRFDWTPDRGELLPGVDLDDRASLFDRMEGIE
jgi:hypothetical protein